ncbi:hypothetical protein CYMTET_47310 [Cymbomonas tetramitiformis]|uniref:Vint domain-containing protein n=1 Tax=Cymbomonas tetramitiformis TaxID=36881 RepID=A0AAE0BUH4_9CHLO|nr:hypothetical protein CYMTET_47310 [Cymbomonas tetramitiformis]
MGWSGDTLLEMADGQAIRVHNIKRGALLRNDLGEAVEVECVVVTTRERRTRLHDEMLFALDYERHMSAHVNISDFSESHRPTARGHSWNPILVPRKSGFNSWMYLHEASTSEEGSSTDTETYDLVLDGSQRDRLVSVFGNVFIPTLGHNLRDNVIAHPYFGTDAVIKDLKKIPGYDEDGRVVLYEHRYKRAQDVTNIVCGYLSDYALPTTCRIA